LTGIYYVEAADWLRSVGLTVVEVDDWETTARSSGGFASRPLGCQWHHTASSGQHPLNDIRYMSVNAEFAPIGNCYLAPDGVIYLIAAGAANTAGKGGPVKMSRGTIPLNSGNTQSWAIEAANNGVGQPWPQVQIDAFFKMSNELNFKFGNLPTDLYTHQSYAPSRKIDPARAEVVQGPWKPSSVTSAGSWSVDDVRAEAQRRWIGIKPPPPKPPPTSEEDNVLYLCKLDTNPNLYIVGDGITSRRVRSDEVDELTNAVTKGIGPLYHDPTKAGRPVITDMKAIPTGSDDFLQLLGIETTESVNQP
jgi:hypothetical protein